MDIEGRVDEIADKNAAVLSAKCIFDKFVDGEADLALADGKEVHVRNLRHIARLKWLQAMHDFKGIRNMVPPSLVTSADASDVFLSLCAAQNVQVVQVAILLHMGADRNTATDTNHRPMHRFAESLQSACCSYLVECKALCDVVETTRSQTPLILACRSPLALRHPRQQLRTIDALLSSKTVLLDHVDCTGNTALDYAISMRRVLVLKRLLAAGASVVGSSWYRSNCQQHNTHDLNKTTDKVECLPDLRNAQCIDFNVTDNWLNLQRTFLSKRALCDRLLNYRLREELALLKRGNATKVWDSSSNVQGTTDHLAVASENTTVEKVAEDAAVIAAAESRRANRHAHREGKNRARAAKAQRAVEAEREQQKELYMKRVEKEYHVSFKGLFA